MKEPLLQVQQLSTHLGDEQRPVRVLDSVDLAINKGETFALLGESGCGKSMTALSIMRLLPPSGRIVEGQVDFQGSDLLRLPETEMRRVRGGRMGMIFQEPMTSLNPVLTVGAQIGEAVKLHNDLQAKAVRERNVELLKSVGIPDPGRRVDEYPHQLSGGMKQRVMIAMALAGSPDLLIADEPTTALDVTIQAQVLRLLGDLQRETGMSILLITHDLGVVAETADRLAVMYAGQIVETAAIKEFFVRPKHPYSEKLFESLPGAEKRSQRLAVIRGSVPRLDERFVGCRFADRCDYATSLCREQEPAWIRSEDGSGVRCHRYDPNQASWDQDSSGPVKETEKGFAASEQPASTMLEVDGLKVHFPIHRGVFKRVVGHVRAVDGVSMLLAVGRTQALVGESGCGKTTVGKSILQLIRPTAGQVRFNGEELTQLRGKTLRRKRADFQIVFQDPYASMNPRMLVNDIICEGMLAQGIGKNAEERREKVAELLQHVGLSADAAKRYPHEFSGGQRQRICIARALAVNPKLIVCDEPTSALDVSVQAQILNLLKELQTELGLSYLFITHNISVVSYLAHDVSVMYLGRIVEQGAVDQVFKTPLHPYTRALLSAVPVPDPEGKRKLIRLEGDMPSPANPPPGCHFHPRCPEVMEQCKKAYPEPIQIGGGHTVRCFLAGAK